MYGRVLWRLRGARLRPLEARGGPRDALREVRGGSNHAKCKKSGNEKSAIWADGPIGYVRARLCARDSSRVSRLLLDNGSVVGTLVLARGRAGAPSRTSVSPATMSAGRMTVTGASRLAPFAKGCHALRPRISRLGTQPLRISPKPRSFPRGTVPPPRDSPPPSTASPPQWSAPPPATWKAPSRRA
jgi:hypothetical protein